MKQYVIDAFTDKIFSGNPAAVCICERFPDDDIMLRIAAENNLSETAFVTEKLDIRWFTPGGEIDLCGHATLASAYVLHRFYGFSGEICLSSHISGELKAVCTEELVSMDFPARPAAAVSDEELKSKLENALGCRVTELYKSRDFMAVTENAETVRKAKPDISLLEDIPAGEFGGFILTARGDDCDFVSRFFCPSMSIPEDPVTGSSHCTLIPYWSERLGKNEMKARQLSARGGTLFAENLGERVKISGHAAVFSAGEIFIDQLK